MFLRKLFVNSNTVDFNASLHQVRFQLYVLVLLPVPLLQGVLLHSFIKEITKKLYKKYFTLQYCCGLL